MLCHLSIGVRDSVRHKHFVRGKSKLVVEGQLVVGPSFGGIKFIDLIGVWRVVILDILTALLVPAPFAFVKMSVALCGPERRFHALKLNCKEPSIHLLTLPKRLLPLVKLTMLMVTLSTNSEEFFILK